MRGESDTVTLFNNIDDGDMIDCELLYRYLFAAFRAVSQPPAWAHACMHGEKTGSRQPVQPVHQPVHGQEPVRSGSDPVRFRFRFPVPASLGATTAVEEVPTQLICLAVNELMTPCMNPCMHAYMC